MSCPWAKIEKTESVNLKEIMCEQIAKTQQVREEEKYDILNTGKNCFKNKVSCTTNKFVTDEKIAQMFQVQYDKEYNNESKCAENKFNSVSSLSEFLDDYRQTNCDSNGDTEEEILDIEVKKDWNILGRELDYIPQYNYNMRKYSKVAMVPDIIMSKRKNNSELSVLSDVKNADKKNFTLQLSHKIFRRSKMVSKHIQNSNSTRLKEQVVNIVDLFSCNLLYKMIDSKLFQNINRYIYGKNAIIFFAQCYLQREEAIPKEIAVKVFRDSILQLKYNLYIKNDNPLKKRLKRPIYLRAENQMVNLVRLKNAGIQCPDFIMIKKNILVMSFIGEKGEPAAKLEYAKMRMEDYIMAYNEVVAAMKIFYEKANLIHADLSKHTIFWYNNHCYFIDVSQSVETSHKDAFCFLYRDCTNVCKFFSSKEVPDVLHPDELFKFITGFSYFDRTRCMVFQSNEIPLRPSRRK